MEKEQRLVEQLRPRQTLDRATEILDDKPHYTQRLKSANRIYQYNRKWERIQLLVDRDNFSVLSVGVFADRVDFRPSFRLSSRSQLTLNRTTCGDEVLGEPFRVFGSCGVYSGSYFEVLGYLAESASGRVIAVGMHNSFRGNINMGSQCVALNEVPEDCVPPRYQRSPWRHTASEQPRVPDLPSRRQVSERSCYQCTRFHQGERTDGGHVPVPIRSGGRERLIGGPGRCWARLGRSTVDVSTSSLRCFERNPHGGLLTVLIAVQRLPHLGLSAPGHPTRRKRRNRHLHGHQAS